MTASPFSPRSWPGILRRRLEGLGFALWLVPLIPLLLAAVAARGARAGTGAAMAVILRRWIRFVLSGWGDLREFWWVQLSLETPWHVWRYVLLLELAELLNLADDPPAAPGEPPRRILVFQPGHLGDLLHTVPLLRTIRVQWPDAHVCLVTGPWNRDLAARIPYASRIEYYAPRWDPFIRGNAQSCRGLAEEFRFFLALRRERYETMLHAASGSLPGLCFFLAVRPGVWAGADCMPGALYRSPSRYHGLSFDSRQYEAGRILSLLSPFGIEGGEVRLEFALTDNDRRQVSAVLREAGVDESRPLAVLAPGAGWPGKQWPPERFAAVADHLAERRGMTVVITGTAGEAALAQDVLRRMRHPGISLASRTTIPVLGALLERAALLVGNDSGPYHLAVAVGTPTIGLFGAGFPTKWASPDRRHRALWHETDCRCWPWHPKAVCDRDNMCMRTISVEEVCAAAGAVLAARAAPA
jgi:ADP-heptose:LPS heptosyltransferase